MATLVSPQVEAERILDGIWTNLAGRRLIPVDPARIATELGCEVFQVDLDPAVSGAIVKNAGRAPTILLSKSDPPNRQRFSCAHELGHFVLRRDDPDEYESIDLRGPESTEGTEPDEIFANQFAASLLMPEKELRDYHSICDGDDVQLAYIFQVSLASMVFRLKNVGL